MRRPQPIATVTSTRAVSPRRAQVARRLCSTTGCRDGYHRSGRRHHHRPIYWAPPGTSIDPAYSTLINQYIADVAAVSGRNDNVYAVNTEYFRPPSTAGGDKIRYKIAAGAPVIVNSAFPAAGSATGCPAHPGYTKCLSEEAARAKLTSLGLPTGLNNIYPVFVPKGIDFRDSAAGFACDSWCGIHGAYRTPADAPVVYALMPWPVDGCEHRQYPQASAPAYDYSDAAIAADNIVGVLSHEINEAVTDPQLDGDVSWADRTGHEIGDECSGIFGKPLGSADASFPQDSEYNQVIDGHRYWTQETFSNLTFNAFGTGQGCVQKAFVPKGADGATEIQQPFGSSHAIASPNNLPNDGTSTATVSSTVTTPNGEPVSDDKVMFTVQAADGEVGSCGDLTGGDADSFATTSAITDDNGEVDVTYTASSDDVVCSIIATESDGGTSDFTNIAQATAFSRVPISATRTSRPRSPQVRPRSRSRPPRPTRQTTTSPGRSTRCTPTATTQTPLASCPPRSP